MWQGSHAATVNGGQGSTTWWNPNNWDVRGDADSFGTNGVNQFHVGVHKAAGGKTLTDGSVDDTDFSVNGRTGTPGVGVMRLEHQGIVSARLRNTGLVSASTPLTVEFFASRFVTSGHWWEVAITPAGTVTGGEDTAVAGYGNPMKAPTSVAGQFRAPEVQAHRPTESTSVIEASRTTALASRGRQPSVLAKQSMV